MSYTEQNTKSTFLECFPHCSLFKEEYAEWYFFRKQQWWRRRFVFICMVIKLLWESARTQEQETLHLRDQLTIICFKEPGSSTTAAAVHWNYCMHTDRYTDVSLPWSLRPRGAPKVPQVLLCIRGASCASQRNPKVFTLFAHQRICYQLVTSSYIYRSMLITATPLISSPKHQHFCPSVALLDTFVFHHKIFPSG